MKKLSKIFLIMFAAFICVLFSACGNKYKNLKINVYDSEGETIESVRLVMDDNDDDEIDLSSARLSVKFTGVKQKDFGNVDIQVPTFLSLTEVKKGMTTSFKISASVINQGYIKILHENSGKTKQIKVIVEQKSNGLLNRNVGNYAISIPSSGEKEALINAEELVTLSPQDSADIVYFKLKNSNDNTLLSVNNIDIIETDEIDGEVLIKGFKLTNVSNPCEVELVPITTLNGFNNTTYSDIIVKIKFVKGLTQSDVELVTDVNHSQYLKNSLEGNGNIILIAKNTQKVENGDFTYQFNNIKMDLKIGSTSFEDSSYFESYTVECETSKPNVFAEFLGDEIVVQANDYTLSDVDVSIKLKPKFIGDLEIIEFNFKVKAELSPMILEVYKDSNLLNEFKQIDLFDYYQKASGSRFMFNPILDYAYSDLRAVRIVINPRILNTDINKVYDNKDFKNERSVSDSKENLYVLEFRTNDGVLKFYYDGENCVSEVIKPLTNVFIKYSEVSGKENAESLEIKLKTDYVGDLDYLKDINGLEEVLTFNRQEGVESLSFKLGTIKDSTASSSESSGKEFEAVTNPKISDGGYIYIDRANNSYATKFNAETNKYEANGKLGLDVDEILGYQNKVITEAKFKIDVVGGKDNPIKLVQINQLSSVTHLDELTLTPRANYNFNKYGSTIYDYKTSDRYILLLVENTTDVGEYTIKFTNENGFETYFKVFVYNQLNEEDISLKVSGLDEEYSFINKLSEETYIFEEYKCDIIASNQSGLHFEIELADYFKSIDYIDSYDFKIKFDGADLPNENDYVYSSKTTDGKLDVTFKKGTYLEGVKYLTIEFEVGYNEYALLTKTGLASKSVQYTFYVYEVIRNINLKSNDELTNTTTIYYDQISGDDKDVTNLGVYYKNLSELTLNVSLNDENLWNYTQKQAQNVDNYLGFVKISENITSKDQLANKYFLLGNKFYPLICKDDLEEEGERYLYNSRSKEFIRNKTGEFYRKEDEEIYYRIIESPSEGTPIKPEDIDIYEPVFEESNVNWYVNEGKNNIQTLDQSEKSIELKFIKANNNNTNFIEVFGSIKQFKLEHTIKYQIYLRDAIITDTIKLNKVTNSVNKENKTQIDYTLNKQTLQLKAGETYKITAKSYSNSGTITKPDLRIIIVDSSGNNLTNSNPNIVVNQDTLELRMSEILTTFDKYKLIIVANDALCIEIKDLEGGYNNFENFLISGHKKAYYVVDLILTDGSISNPYVINSAEDLLDVEANYHYVVMNNINLLNKDISNLSNLSLVGSIRGYNGNQYTISGIKLTNTNFIKEIKSGAQISDLKFIVEFDYDNLTNKTLGLIGTNNGTILNVTVQVSGDCESLSSSTFGGLVGLNNGTVQYTKSVVGVLGSITIDENSNCVVFGGLVGENKGQIIGAEDSLSSTLEISSISVTNKSQDNDSDNTTFTATGGVVGLNNSGTIKNIYVSGSIFGVNNVGGVVGRNVSSTEQTVQVTSDDNGIYTMIRTPSSDCQISNVTSLSLVKGSNNVGGIVGYDLNGSYSHLRVQISDVKLTKVEGNQNIGGIAGYSSYGYFEYSSVMSYRWDYADMLTTFNDRNPDISGNQNVAGLVGFVESTETITTNSGNKTFAINSCSVNAYLKVTDTNKNVVGLFNSNNSSIVVNAYFMGLMKKDNIYSSVLEDETSFGLANTEYKYHTYCYDFNKEDKITGTYNDNWLYNSNINGGNIYIVDKDNKPIFEIAPTSVSVAVINSEYQVEDVINVMNLNYFILDDLSSNDLNFFNIQSYLSTKNTHNVSDLFDIVWTPTGISPKYEIKSDNTAVIAISESKIIIVKGIGQANLIFKSVLSGVSTEVIINVTYPNKGIILSTDKNDETKSISGKHIGVGKDTSELFFEIIEKDVYIFKEGTEEEQTYHYIANENICYKVSVDVDGFSDDLNSLLAFANKSSDNLETIAGKKYYIYNILDSELFSIKAKDVVQKEFTISVQPYIQINVGANNYSKEISDNVIEFYLKTFRGPTDISLNHASLTLYPNDLVDLVVKVSTDEEISTEKILISGYANYYNSEELILTESNINGYYNFIQKTALINSSYQNFTYHLNNENLDFGKANKIDLYLTFTLNELQTSIKITFVKQRISDMEIKNYIYEDESLLLKDVLKPYSEGLIVINPVPDNAYFDYLEIIDATGDEEITFAQITSEEINSSYASETWSIPSKDGKGIKLLKVKNSLTYYVKTMIDASYSSKKHTIKVLAYINGQVLQTFTAYVEVRMLPSVVVSNILPDDSLEYYKDTNSYYAANGVDIRLKVETKNADEVFVYSISSSDNTIKISDYYTIDIDYDRGIITLKAKQNNSLLLDKTITIRITVRSSYENGEFDEFTQNVSYTIKPFVVHSVSVTHSLKDENGDYYIYGNYNDNIKLEFYFKPTDISYNSNGTFWVSEYKYDASLPASADNNLQAINSILGEINKTSNNEYLSFVNEDNKKITSENLELSSGTTLTVKGEIEKTYLQVAYSDSNNQERNIKKNFELRFSEMNSFVEPTAILTAEDFLNMNSGENYYILANDIELVEYTPRTFNVKSFDGNGHKIRIKSFAFFNEVEIKAGLFEEIPEGMVVTNLEVKYEDKYFGNASINGSNVNVSRYYDFCNNENVDYTSLTFGGIASVNNGVISNCKVSGKLIFRASVIESKVSNDNVQINVGGFVGNNGSTGYITNSFSNLQMISKSNIAGFAYANAGKIASCEFDATNSSNGFIYAYNSSVETQYSVLVSGFVVENTGEISMSCVESTVTNSIGNISAKDESAGFVLNNNGEIYDCFVNISKIGTNNNIFYGFVKSNSGSVYNCYTSINGGVLPSNTYLFAASGTTGIKNSYEVKLSSDIVYNNNVENLKTLTLDQAANKDYFKNFSFGTLSNDAVWIYNGRTPKLVSVLESKNSNTFINYQNNSSTTYNGLKTITKVKGYYDDENVWHKVKSGDVTSDIGFTIIDRYITDFLEYGSKSNPILIYDLTTWNFYFAENNNDYKTKYFRILSDIDFDEVLMPSTTSYEFMGNIQGNNMDIKNILIYSKNQSLSSIGLFKELIGANDSSISNSIRNLDISIKSIQASYVQSVGTLAGIVENFNLYNIDIISNDNVILGGNAVGGVAGIVRGKFDIDGITSDASVQSSMVKGSQTYSVYMSVNNKEAKSSNLVDVSYAGSMFGILDGYLNSNFNINDTRLLTSKTKWYSYVKNCSLNGSFIGKAETVGVAFGLATERVWVESVDVTITGGSVAATQKAAGVIGELRGVAINCSFISTNDDFFKLTTGTCGGVVGFNIGGYVENCSVKANITLNSNTVGGIVGTNVSGFVKDSSYDGQLVARFTGGIIGSDYKKDDYIKSQTNEILNLFDSNLITAKQLNNILPDELSYEAISETLTNVSVSKETVEYWLNNLNRFYKYNQSSYKVLGIFIGVTTRDYDNMFVKFEGNEFKLASSAENSLQSTLTFAFTNKESEIETGTKYVLIDNSLDVDKNYSYIMYCVGARLSVYETWSSTYNPSITLFTTQAQIDAGSSSTEP